MPDLAIDPKSDKRLVAQNYPLAASHRHFSRLTAIHPLGMIHWENGERDRAITQASPADLDERGTRQWCGSSLSRLANLAARARDGEKAEQALEVFARAFCLRNGFHCNGDQSGKGYSDFRYRPFTLEGHFAAAAGLQEMLLQSYRGTVRVFPAVPASRRDASFKGLHAEGAFVLSTDRKDGRTQSVELVGERRGLLRLENPCDRDEYALTGAESAQVRTDGPDLLLDLAPGQKVALSRQ